MGFPLIYDSTNQTLQYFFTFLGVGPYYGQEAAKRLWIVECCSIDICCRRIIKSSHLLSERRIGKDMNNLFMLVGGGGGGGGFL